MSKLLERLNWLRAQTTYGSKHDVEYTLALHDAYPKLRAVVEAAKRACDAHSWGGIPHEEANELAEALEALEEGEET